MSAHAPFIRLTRRYHFSAAHRLHSPLLSEQENRTVYGKCNNPFGHGHDYALEVTVRGPLDTLRGRLVPLALLDRLVQEVVLHDMDRRNLNAQVTEFAALVPTTENLALVIARRLRDAWHVTFPSSPAAVEKVRISETRKNIFEVFAPALPEDSALGAREAFEQESRR
jgi:6-pyruvoyltetrahydropterin/6-carboxytetrahydropterin synthase